MAVFRTVCHPILVPKDSKGLGLPGLDASCRPSGDRKESIQPETRNQIAYIFRAGQPCAWHDHPRVCRPPAGSRSSKLVDGRTKSDHDELGERQRHVCRRPPPGEALRRDRRASHQRDARSRLLARAQGYREGARPFPLRADRRSRPPARRHGAGAEPFQRAARLRTVPHPHRLGMTDRSSLGTYDYVIVGGGTAGCLLANRLSADPDVSVLLLEAGGKDDYLWIHIPVGYLYCMGNPRTDWCFKTEAEAGLGGRAINYPRGKVLGGCSSINGMIYMRGQARDYDQWRQLGNRRWGWDDVLPHFRQHEDYVHGADEAHGAGGEWRIDRQRLHWPILDTIRDAAVEAGLPRVTDFNRGDNHGVAYFHVTQRGGIRVNTAKAFLKPVRNRRNLRIVSGAQAKRVLIENGRAIGVEAEVNATAQIAHARGEVILSAGAIGSPHLLELSGIGQPERLRDLGIDVVRALGGVGENLQDHLQLRLIYKIRNALTLNTLAANLWGKARIGLEYLLRQSGPMSMAPSQLGAFAKSDPSLETPDLEYHIQPLSLDRFGEPLHPSPAVTMSVCNLRPESRGSVHATSAHFGASPAIRPT